MLLKKKKVERRKGTTYEPRLFYYDELTFLDPVVVLRTSLLMESFHGDDPLKEKTNNRPMNGKRLAIKKKERQDSTDEEIERVEYESTRSNYDMSEINGAAPESPQPQLTQPESPQPEVEMPTDLSKEETFCAMICSELKLLKSEDVYDNLTLEIFSIVKNAKMAERHIVYQPEDDMRRT
ncbi:uncharacterized protein LOC118748878 [Rhagoletis pomonella]|uniref:uncharacterized protein LOC118748878 n=1 Tax=Rhagoletis pomonella TaxID=28610 RepID=UPI0017863943|nr:uncharacterized protein LOC118748878 [Rhagoletis pomonella]